MAHGGKRLGAGRKRSGINRISEAARVAAAKTGLLPHELLLAVVQGRAKEVLGHDVSVAVRLDAAKAAAPFYAPKLIAMAAKVTSNENPFEELLKLVDGKTRGLPNGLAGLERWSMPGTKAKH